MPCRSAGRRSASRSETADGAHRGLRADRRPAGRGARRARRLDRLALLPALRLGRVLRRAARHAGARPLAARARRVAARQRAAISTTRWCSRRPGRPTTASCASSTSCRRAATRPTSCASSRAFAAASRCGRSSSSGSTTGSVVPWVRRVGDTRLAVAGPDALCFRTPAHTRGENMRTISEFTIEEGERVPFALDVVSRRTRTRPQRIDPEVALAETESFWREWNAQCTVDLTPEWRDLLHRSLMVLKTLIYAPTGGIVAAPTTSLPEWIGGVRNWDYRYCWLRDATLTLLALLQAGHIDEALDWRAVAASRRRRRSVGSSRSCTASPASGASPSSSCRGCRATRARRRCGSATRRASRSRSTSTAR